MHALRTYFLIPPTSHSVYRETIRALRSLVPVEVRERRYFAIGKTSDKGFLSTDASSATRVKA